LQELEEITVADPQLPKDMTPVPAVPGATPETPKRKTILDFFAPVVPLLPFLAMLGAAFWAGQAWDEKRANTMESYLRERQSVLEGQIKDSKEKDAQDREAVAILTTKLNSCGNLIKADVAAASPQAHLSDLDHRQSSEVETQVISGETAKVFSRQLFITLRAIQPSPAAPPRYQAFATLGAPGKSSEDFHGDAGQSKQFAGFEIRIIGVDAATATFHIRKLDSPAPAP
jgi:hypothetical protein